MSASIVRSAFLSLVPGALYLKTSSMADHNVALSNYLREIPGFRYLKGKSFMLIHELMMGTSLAMGVKQPSITARKRFAVGAWAIPKTGTYKGDLGMVIYDTYNKSGHPGDIIRDHQCRMLFIPRLNKKPLESLHARN